MEKPSRDSFNLSKVKLLPHNGGVTVEYQISEVSGGEPCVTDYQVTRTQTPHPDLLEQFRQLRSIVGRVFGITSFLSYLQAEKYPAMESARAFADELLQKYEVRGLSWSGTGSGAGVVITSVFETESGLKTAVNTPRIKTEQISYGFEEDLERIASDVKDEVYNYLFEGKQAQMSLFGEGDE